MTVPDGGGRGDVARILVTEPVDEAGLRLLEAEHEVVRRPGCTPEELLALIPEFDALIVRSATQVTAEVLRAARRLQVVGRAGVGVNNIDVETATQRGIVVVNVPDGNTIAATEQTFALLLAVARRLPDAVQSLREGRWEREAFVGTELRGKTMGIVGLGRIGQEVARRAQAFGMSVCAYDPLLTPERAAELGVRSLPLDDVLRAADVLTVHTPLTPETRGMIGARELALLPPGAIVLNCARGGIVDERALYEALTSGHLGGAGLDVFEREPATDNPLVRLPNVVATPHLGASTREAQSVSAIEVAKYVRAVLAGEPVPTAVNLPGLSQRDWEVVRPLVPLGELLGRLYRQGLGGQLGQVEVVTGPLPARGGDWVASAVLKGCLAGLVDDVVNLVNAQRVAAAHGVKVVHSQSTEVPERALTVRVHAGGRTRVVAGHALADGSLRVTNLDGMPIEMAPMRHMLLTRHRDRPGLIGAVGTVLGQAGVNIAAMLVGRQAVRGDAVMVLAVDDPVEPEVLARLRTIPGMEAVRSVVLPDHLLPPEPVVRGVAS
jgi:D-3-phosphoglycerate dehydrogenase